MSACPICGGVQTVPIFRGSDRLYRTTTDVFAVVRCAQCGMSRLEPQPSRDVLRRYYPENYWFAPDPSAASRMEEAYRRLVLRDHVQFVARALAGSKARGPLLDVGCGGGLFLGMMRERGVRVVGLDFSREAAAVAWSRQQAPATTPAQTSRYKGVSGQNSVHGIVALRHVGIVDNVVNQFVLGQID